jgi:hypothetical protein
MQQHVAPPERTEPLLQAANMLAGIACQKIKTVSEREELLADLQTWLNKLRKFEEEQQAKTIVRPLIR